MQALLLVDIQNDFCPGGALPVPRGDEVIPVANKLLNKFSLVIATQDWHPKGHISFASTHGKKIGEIIEVEGIKQILWPDHCVQNSWGADFPAKLNREKIDYIVYKGTHPKIDSYSGFFDNARQQKTSLDNYLQEKKVSELYVLGLATDYCVKFTVLDGLSLGYKVYVVVDGCRGVDLNPGDVQKALEEMQGKGARLITSEEIK
ncbi:MAG TPA: bifunctional nicotinamidase/pyrazinamidase [Desulfonauticus sp.]|jgi:nicotinamidase/pyrazinamidase|nr:MAG: Pyrazinamidase/nicotinamidase [Desulfonauticus sp. 38_4375]MDK2922394.1 nicotinamidase/pyrazinamidase [Desulfonauticus sp.]HCO11623.1 bifunctional nicotinamidase/pyrazinamidase [Desulfonauticus sp.]